MTSFLLAETGTDEFPYRDVGSGFIVRCNNYLYIITAKHVPEGDSDNAIQTSPEDLFIIPGFPSPNERELLSVKQVSRPTGILGVQANRLECGDFIIYKTDSTSRLNYPVFEVREQTNDWYRRDNFDPFPLFAMGYPKTHRSINYDEETVRQRLLFIGGNYEKPDSRQPHVHAMRLVNCSLANSGQHVSPTASTEEYDGICGGPVLQNISGGNFLLAGVVITCGGGLLRFIDMKIVANALLIAAGLRSTSP